MASVIDIDALLDFGENTAVNVKPLAAQMRSITRQRPSIDKANVVGDKTAEALEQIQDVLDQLLKAIGQAPEVTNISIDSADLRSLVVGGRRGPGELLVLNGAPNYEEIGFIGVRVSDEVWTIATLVDETITTTTAHSLRVGDAVFIDGPSDIEHQGYWDVSAVISDTVFEIADPPSASGTGGTAILIWRGGWMKSLSIGGTGFEDAPFFFDPTGQGYIGQFGKLTLLGPAGTERGWLGADFEASKNVSGVANAAGLFRVTVATHGYATGDTVYLQDIGGTPDANGEWAITVIDANNFDLDDSVFAGAYTSGGTSTLYWDAAWLRRAFLGGVSREEAPFKVAANGDVIIDNRGLSSRATFVLDFNGVTTEVNNSIEGSNPFGLRTTLNSNPDRKTWVDFSGIYSENGAGATSFSGLLSGGGGSEGGGSLFDGTAGQILISSADGVIDMDGTIILDIADQTIAVGSTILIDAANNVVSIDDPSGVLRINGNDVVQDTVTGWSIGGGGSPGRSFGATFPPATASVAYVQSEMQTVMDQSVFLSEVLMALLLDLSSAQRLIG